jgi:hypothetical protein
VENIIFWEVSAFKTDHRSPNGRVCGNRSCFDKLGTNGFHHLFSEHSKPRSPFDKLRPNGIRNAQLIFLGLSNHDRNQYKLFVLNGELAEQPKVLIGSFQNSA